MAAKQSPPDRTPPPPPPEQWLRVAIMLVAIVITLALVLDEDTQTSPAETRSYSAVKEMIASGQVTSATLAEHAITVSVLDAAGGTTRYRATTPAQSDPSLLPLLEEQEVPISADPPSDTSIWMFLLPWMLILGVYFWLQRRMIGQMGGGMGEGGAAGLFKGRFSTPAETRSQVTFADVAGQEQAKREVAELVDFLRDPERYQSVGAEVPHGVTPMPRGSLDGWPFAIVGAM